MSKIEEIKKWSNKFENNAVKVVAFYGTITVLFGVVAPFLLACLVWLFFFFRDIANISNYVNEFRRSTEYNNFQIMQLTHIVEAESDPKNSYGIPVRMTNAPKGHKMGDLWYFTNIKINGVWRPITYGAFPNKTKQHVGILNMDGKYKVAGTEKKPLNNH